MAVFGVEMKSVMHVKIPTPMWECEGLGVGVEGWKGGRVERRRQ